MISDIIEDVMDKKINVYVEFGPNISSVLLSMVGKLQECNPNESYYDTCFDNIRTSIIGAVEASVKNNTKGFDK